MGLQRHCVRYKPVRTQFRTNALRCVEYAKNRGGKPQSPACDPRLVGGGRSRGLLRPATKSCGRRRARR
jgi:hypothetical protein